MIEHAITVYVDGGDDVHDGDAVFRCSCGLEDGTGGITDVILQAGSHLLGDEEDQDGLSPDGWIRYVKSGMSEAGIDFAEWRWLVLKAGIDVAAADEVDSWRQVEPPVLGPFW